MNIDSHQHFWNYDPAKYSWINDSMHKIKKDFLPSDLAPVLQKNGIGGTVAVEAFHSEKETEFLLDLASEFPFIKAVVGWVDLYSENVGSRLKMFSKNPVFKGVRHTVYDEKGEFLTENLFQKGIAALGKFGLTYDLLIFEHQLPGAIELMKKFPKQRFVLDHMAKPRISPDGPSEEWTSNIRTLAENKNVFCKVSGLVTETPGFHREIRDFIPFLDVVVDAFGEDRLMFGSDWPVCLSAADYEDTMAIVRDYFAAYGEESMRKLLGGNAARCYRIPV
ncbi:amidohydrolase family protein [Salinimicrobium sp. GXAS 041]|uniref:amidohydrolase family protein n=1 Tax=Salinimicrobium sp. GXAS 041 TaxID=3400806 RepID=UPI003C70ACBF